VRDLDLPDASVDAVLLLGPLYHLTDRAERVRALRQCARIVRTRGWRIRPTGPLRWRWHAPSSGYPS
jgi:SAM-dependent methyltransferase